MNSPFANRFGDLEPSDDPAAFRILPVPYERTTSYGRGTQRGPEAVLEASRYLELYDEELAIDTWRRGIETLDPVVCDQPTAGEALAEIRRRATAAMESTAFVAAVGGEHGLTPPLVEAAVDRFGPVGVVQFDAHADLRDRYEGAPHSHACAMKRLIDLGLPTLGIGVRSLSAEEADLIDERDLPILWGHEIFTAIDGGQSALRSALDDLPEQVYLTFDVDFFDPGVMPATGTPEPGGGDWHAAIALLREVFDRKRVVAMDLVELAPMPAMHAPDFMAAKLLYRCLGLRSLGPGSPDYS